MHVALKTGQPARFDRPRVSTCDHNVCTWGLDMTEAVLFSYREFSSIGRLSNVSHGF